ncbi:MAG: hypothetical protein KIIPBIDF_01686 [Candidatus Methanoperedenaceae archaeon GB50]|nr:MAG: hypothetical protein KIIPBIDF_01686 [Candidatus Methanoperedenaceae archaeon GB50]
MIIFPVEDDKGFLPYERDYIAKTIEWLNSHPNFNIKDFSQACEFMNILDYKANDYEARDTLIDLYECVLYADEAPRNIQLRNGKPIYLVVVDPARGEGRKKEDKINDAIAQINIRENTISVDIGVGWKLIKDNVVNLRLDFDKDKKRWVAREINEVVPFSYYLLDINYYDSFKGVTPDAGIFI